MFSWSRKCLSIVLKQIQIISSSVKTKVSRFSWKMFEVKFKFSKLVKSTEFRCLRANKTLGYSEYSICFAQEKMKKEISLYKKSKSVKSLKYMDEVFFPTNDFSRLESCQLYMIAKYKPSNCCKVEVVIQRCFVKNVFLMIFHRKTFVPESKQVNKVDVMQVLSCEYCEIFKNTFFVEHLRWLPLVKLEFLLNTSGGCLW